MELFTGAKTSFWCALMKIIPIILYSAYFQDIYINKNNNIMANILENIKKDFIEPIKTRTKSENPIADGIKCPHCGAFEAYKNPENRMISIYGSGS